MEMEGRAIAAAKYPEHAALSGVWNLVLLVPSVVPSDIEGGGGDE